MLEDLLDYNLILVICGTAVSNYSANLGIYYAGSTNKFWGTLYNVGLTTEKIESENYRRLLSHRIGLTDLVKAKSGLDNSLASSDFEISEFKRKILKFAPKILCFNGKKAASVYFSINTRYIIYGLQEKAIGDTKIFIAPSTSGAAVRYWDVKYWKKLSILCQTQK